MLVVVCSLRRGIYAPICRGATRKCKRICRIAVFFFIFSFFFFFGGLGGGVGLFDGGLTL